MDKQVSYFNHMDYVIEAVICLHAHRDSEVYMSNTCSMSKDIQYSLITRIILFQQNDLAFELSCNKGNIQELDSSETYVNNAANKY